MTKWRIYIDQDSLELVTIGDRVMIVTRQTRRFDGDTPTCVLDIGWAYDVDNLTKGREMMMSSVDCINKAIEEEWRREQDDKAVLLTVR